MPAQTSAQLPAVPAPAHAGLRAVVQLPFVASYLLVCLTHALSILWLFTLPRYRREPFAFRLCCDPWAWYSTKLFLRPRIRVLGREHLPSSWHGYLYASNHESLVDILLLTKEIRRGFLMKRTVLLSPIGWGTYLSGSVAFDRSSKRARADALRRVITMAKRSMSVVVFPEGTFGHADGRLREPHLNLLRQAWQERIPVVPLGHAGSRRALDGQTLPVRRGVDLVLAARRAVQPADYADADSFARDCWQQVVEAVTQARSELAPGWPYEQGP
jgi:1-acyl-sn-glycerol-3-phosphate acyltransferase